MQSFLAADSSYSTLLNKISMDKMPTKDKIALTVWLIHTFGVV